jgi:putative membrane protein
MKVNPVMRYVLGAMIVLPLPLLAQIPGSAIPTSAAGTPMPDTPSRSGSQATPGVGSSSIGMQDSSQNGSVSNDVQLAKDRMFVRKASEGGLAEVQLGQLAAQKAGSDDVKKLGQRMVDDHTTMDSNLAPIADQLGVRTPDKLSKADQDEYNKLSALSGADFDKAYLTVMLKDHRKDLHDFRTEEAQTTDPELKDAVAGQEKVIAAHLYLVNKLALANGVPSAYKGSATAAASASATPPQ